MKDKLLLLLFILFISNNINANQIINNNTFEQKAAIVNNDFTTENALHDAVRANDIELVKLLIEKNVLKNQPDQYGYTPLHLAVRLHNLEIVKYLIEQNVDLNTLDSYKDTPLLDATRNNDTEIAKVLICNGAYRNVKDNNNISTLNNSSRNNNTYITKLLIANDLDQYCKIAIEKIDIVLDNNTTIEPNIQQEIKVETKDTNNIAEVENLFVLNTNDELYKALMEEFENDFVVWNASLQKDTLAFKLEDTTLMFSVAKKDINEPLKKILDNFLPRYINILLYFQSDINKVIINGHTSSEYSKAIDDDERYQYNLQLSQNRADEVLRYLKDLDNPLILENYGWITTTIESKGKSSSELIYNEDGTENKELSRRIEFVINLKQDK